MESAVIQESADVTKKLAPDDLPTFLLVLRSRRPAEWNMSRRTFYRWREGDVSEALEILFANWELAQAFASDAMRAHVEHLGNEPEE